MKNKGAYTSFEAIDVIKNTFGYEIDTKITDEDNSSWSVTFDNKTIKVAKWYKADYSSCKKDK